MTPVDADDASPTVAVVLEVADAEGTDPLDLPPLHDAIDPDYLNRLGADPTADESILFRYVGYLVHVTAAGDVAVRDPDGHREVGS